MAEPTVIQSRDEFTDDARGWASRWKVEFASARSFLTKWHESAKICLDAFEDARNAKNNEDKERHVNLYWANVLTQMALMYGQVPEVDVSRRFNDQNDQTARVAGPVILQRLLNTDIERTEDGFRNALRHALCDYLTVGFCNARVRYVAEFEEQDVAAKMSEDGRKELAPGYQTSSKKSNSEDVITDYLYWENQLWSPSRTFEEWRWWAYSTLMSKDDVAKRFGKKIARKLSYNAKAIRYAGDDTQHNDVFTRVEVWEIWSKENKKVYWFVEGYDEVLDVRDDPYGLRGFWPFPEPILANTTTRAHVPKPDYALAQDQYASINELSSRIGLLEKSLKVAGVYDSKSGDLQRLLSEGRENILLPVENWAALKEGGGIKGVIEWWPIEQIVAALEQLREQREEEMKLLYEVTGQSDLQRGESTQPDESARAATAKVRYGSVRVQHRQDEFALFASRLQQLRAELIVKLFDPTTIIRRSNVMLTPDAGDALQAIQLLKSEFPSYRIMVRPEAIAQQDFASLQNERTQFLTAFSSMMHDAVPAVQSLGPMGGVVVGELLKWALAGFRGSKEIEGVLDKAIEQAQQQVQQQAQNPQQQQQDPKLAEIQAKQNSDMVRIQAKAQADAERIQLETQAEGQRQQMQTAANAQQTAVEERIKLEAEARRAAMRPAPVVAPVPRGKKP